MYTLYHDKSKKEIKVSKAKKVFQNLNYTDDVTRYNNCYYICKTKKPLVEKAEEMKRNWIDELEEQLNKLNEIKF